MTNFTPSSRDKSEQIARSLAQRVSEGRWQPADRLPKRDALMAEFNVSRATIQKVFDELMGHGFFESRGVAGTFVKHTAPCLNRIALVNATRREDYWTPNFHRIARVGTHWRDYCPAADSPHALKNTTVFEGVNSHPGNAEPQKLLEEIKKNRLHGCIFLHPPEETFDLKQLDETGVPYMLYGRETTGLYPSIAYDIATLAQQAAQHAAKIGCKRMGVLTHHAPDSTSMIALRDEAESLGVHLPVELIQMADVRMQPAAVQAALLLCKLPKEMRPDCIYVTEEFFMESACLGIARAGLEIGRDIQVIGRTDVPFDSHAHRSYIPIGFDIAGAMNLCMDILASLRNGEDVPHLQMIPPLPIEQTLALATPPVSG